MAVIALGMELLGGRSAIQSLGEALLFLASLGGVIALGTIAGTFFVAFYLVIFGWPAAFLLGEKITGPAGLLAAAVSAGAGTLFALSLLTGWSVSSSPFPKWEALIPIAVFAAPAAFFYRRYVISALDEGPLD